MIYQTIDKENHHSTSIISNKNMKNSQISNSTTREKWKIK